MIRRDEITPIGKIFKPHGIKGEMTAGLDYDLDISALKCIILDVDGIYVPFFIASSRPSGRENLLIRIDGIDDEKSAAAFSNKEIYGLKSEVQIQDDEPAEDGVYLTDLIGYELLAADRSVGVIDFIDDSTENILFNVKTEDGKIVLVPFVDEWIESFDPEKKIIVMNIPEGVLNLND